ncbi:hypothetical protein UYA_02510 [Ectopseudomonas alcaliphila JAB1]|nr:hypothetical protein UYA_02510 [Pseudomonas alcaliphila JAB1]
MISPQIVTNLDPVNPTSPTHKREKTTIVRKRPHHFEDFDIKAFQKLLDPGLVRTNFWSTLDTTNSVNFDWRLKRTPQRSSSVDKSFIGRNFR